MVYRL